MKPPEGNEDKLSKLLQEWKPAQSLPPRFQEAVWKRIDRGQAARAGAGSWWAALLQKIDTLLAHPARATAYLTLLLAVAAVAGWTQAHQTNARVKGALGEQYVRVLDPYQAPRN